MKARSPAALASLFALPFLFSFACGGADETKDASAKTDVSKKTPDAGHELEKDASPEKTADGGAATEAETKEAKERKAAEEAAKAMEFAAASDELQKIAEALEERRVALDLKEREVIEREQLLESLETAAIEKTAQLKALETEASALLDKLSNRYEDVRKTYDDDRKERAATLKDTVETMAAEREDRTAQLVASLKGMRPSAGAGLLASMKEEDAVEVLRKLSARQSAALLGEMPPAKAAELAEAMIGPKLPSAESLPNPEETEGAKP